MSQTTRFFLSSGRDLSDIISEVSIHEEDANGNFTHGGIKGYVNPGAFRMLRDAMLPGSPWRLELISCDVGKGGDGKASVNLLHRGGVIAELSIQVFGIGVQVEIPVDQGVTFDRSSFDGPEATRIANRFGIPIPQFEVAS